MDIPVNSPESCLHAVENKIKCLEESTLATKVYRNTLVPISRLPPEILSIVFSLLPCFEVLDPESYPPTLSSPVSHVCHQWRDISLDLPHLWNHINFIKLPVVPACTAVMLVRAKTAPLYLEAQTTEWSAARFEAFKEQIKAHIHHIRHLSVIVTPSHLMMFKRFESAAPSLEFFSVGDRRSAREYPPVKIPDNLFGGIAPKLTYLRLCNCGISWKSPLLKGLRDLELFSFPKPVQTTFHCWFSALKEMPQLERLVLHDSILVLSEELKPTVDLPSLTELRISVPARECGVVLAHLVLPALKRLCINARIYPSESSVKHLIRCVAQNAHGPQDTEALQSLFIGGKKKRADFVTWTMPGQDSDDGLGSLWRSSIDLPDGTRPARLIFSILNPAWQFGMNIRLYNSLLAALPLNYIASLTVKGRTPLSKADWRSHASRWHKLERVRLFNDAVPAFRAMFEDAAVVGVPLLPSLEEIILVDISLNAQKVYYLCDMLIECLELGIPLTTLDLRTCTATNRAVRLLSEIVIDVRSPVKKKSGDPNGRGVSVLGEDGGRGEEDDGPDGVTPSLGSWNGYQDIEDGESSSDNDSDDSSYGETLSTDSES